MLLVYVFFCPLQYIHENTFKLLDTTNVNSVNDITSQISDTYKGHRFEIRRISNREIEFIDFELHIVVTMQWNSGSNGHINFHIQLTGSICQNSDFEIIGHLGDCNGIEDSMDHDLNPTDGMNHRHLWENEKHKLLPLTL